MLVVIEDEKAKTKVQRKLKATLQTALSNKGRRKIGFPSGQMDETVYANKDDSLWAAFTKITEAKIPRNWNAFGVFESSKSMQLITVEINIAIGSNDARVAGFFAKNLENGNIYLMHDGGVGGGKLGVGQTAFLAWSKANLVDASKSIGGKRRGIVVGCINSPDFQDQLWAFVRLVRGFKDAVNAGDLDDPVLRQTIGEWEKFSPENSGERRSVRRSTVDYISYHGEVVRLLHSEATARGDAATKVYNNQLIDLYIREGDLMTEIYEVKTSLDRQSIYTAIGQLFCHSLNGAANLKRHLVIPAGNLATDLEQCLVANSILVRRFELSKGANVRVVLLKQSEPPSLTLTPKPTTPTPSTGEPEMQAERRAYPRDPHT